MKQRKNLFERGVLLLALVLSLVIAPLAIHAKVVAAGDSTPAVANAREGVLQINLVYQDNSGRRTVLKTGSGFLVGPASGARTIITNDHVVRLTDEEKSACTTTFGVDFFNANNINLLIQVVVKRDIVIDASYKNGSEIGDYAILQLSDSIFDRAPLKLGDSENLQETQAVYALGFPFTASWVSDDQTYVSSDVTITNGIVGKFQNINNIPYILHNAGLSYGNSGGPLVDSNGNVVGVNTMYAGNDGNNYYYSIAINEIRGTLDALGITYETGSNSSTVVETLPTAAPIQDNNNNNGGGTVPVVNPTNNPTTGSQGGSNIGIDPIVAPQQDNTMLIIIIAIVVILVVVAIVVIAVVASGKNKRTVPGPMGGAGQMMNMNVPPMQGTGSMQSQGGSPSTAPRGGSAPIPPSYNTMPANSGEGLTGVLNGPGSDATGVLGGPQASQMSATLVRMKNNESVTINKPSFVIGKERAKVDFCVPDNNMVSREHAQITFRGGEYFITDKRSTNFTYINGNKIAPNQETKLQSGDKIKLADEEFTIRF